MTDIKVMCGNCHERPVAGVVKCGFLDWCTVCDDALYSTRLKTSKQHTHVAGRHPTTSVFATIQIYTTHNVYTQTGFGTARLCNPLARPGKENVAQHMLVAIPVTNALEIILCLKCKTYCIKKLRQTLEEELR